MNPLSVLIVEDERIVALDLQQTLQEMGYDAFAMASSADEAILRVTERCPDLVLMDIRIEGSRDGIETAAILHQRFDLPVVFLTAHADDATLERAKQTSPHGYLLKPVKPAELRSAIEVGVFRHRMERQLRQRERWFSTTLHSIADAVVAVDLAGKISFMNRAAELLSGVVLSEALGKSVGEVLHLLDQRKVEAVDTPLDQVLRTHQPVAPEEASLRNVATGASRLIHDSAAPVMDGAEHLGAVMVFRDVTEERKLRQQVEFSDRLASLGTMAAGVAHEINNPLAVISANAHFLSEEWQRLGTLPAADPDHRSEIGAAIEDVRQAAARIATIVSSLKGFSRPTVAPSDWVSLVHCAEWAVRTTAHEFGQRARVVTDFASVPEIRADEARLGQVLINLLVNAAHAIAPGHFGQNEVRIATRTDSRGWALVEVRDTGGGIPTEALNQIFEPFYTTKPAGQGTGLGLSICHGIVTSMGGDITVESTVGVGTVFRVAFPPSSGAKVQVVPSAAATPTKHGRFLVIDDEESNLRAIRRCLRGHEVVCLQDARTALALLDKGERFDGILSDVLMPRMTGIEFYEALLSRNPSLARRVAFISGGSITERTVDFLQTVSNLRLEKPFTTAELNVVIQKLLALEPGEAKA